MQRQCILQHLHLAFGHVTEAPVSLVGPVQQPASDCWAAVHTVRAPCRRRLQQSVSLACHVLLAVCWHAPSTCRAGQNVEFMVIDLQDDEAGSYAGFDRDEFTSRSGGKLSAVKHIKVGSPHTALSNA